VTEQGRRIQEQFGGSAAAYVTSAGHAGGDDLEQLLAWGRTLRPGRVLDVATGGGHTALAFAAIARHVTAYDLTEPMLQVARGFLRDRGAGAAAFVAGDVASLPFRDGAFDVVTCRIAAHHFADVAGAVREVRRVLRPAGSLLLQDILGHDDAAAAAFVTEVERRRDPTHVRAYRQVEWKAFLRAAGLTMIHTATVAKLRPWDEWTRRTRMTPEARRDLEDYVRAAPAACRAAFAFQLAGDRVESFTDRMLLVRADRD
jgi:ubiquinone/menaquinone biosynthesis C-methylase UbiE